MMKMHIFATLEKAKPGTKSGYGIAKLRGGHFRARDGQGE
jgi:hypothetical protein